MELFLVVVLVGAFLCGGFGLVLLAVLLTGMLVLLRSGSQVTVRKAVTAGAESVSQVFARRGGVLVPVDPESEVSPVEDPADAEPMIAQAALAEREADEIAITEATPRDDEADVPEPAVVETTGVTELVATVRHDETGIVEPEPLIDPVEAPPPPDQTTFAPRRLPLQRAGFFADLPHGDEDGGSLEEARNDAPQPHEARIVAYLRAAPVLVSEAEPVVDVLDSDEASIGPASIHTDGVWAWPADLAHYVERYHVTLPTPFIEHLVDRGYEVGDVDLDLVELASSLENP